MRFMRRIGGFMLNFMLRIYAKFYAADSRIGGIYEKFSHTCTCTHMHTCTHTRAHAHMHTTPTPTYLPTYMHTYISPPKGGNVCMHVGRWAGCGGNPLISAPKIQAAKPSQRSKILQSPKNWADVRSPST